ncbi:MAG: L-histidine N(alpha)-methyltransferase [Candidatus Thermochlorobacter sp.]
MSTSVHTIPKIDASQTQRERQAQSELLYDVLEGLSASPKRLPSKYFYDDEGSRLFQKIMSLPEYYLTRAEAEILEQHRMHIVSLVAHEPFTLVELGAGDGSKTSLLIERLLQEQKTFFYAPIDISSRAIEVLTQSLATKFPTLRIHGITDEYFHGLKQLRKLSRQSTVALFLGSNIGNFTKEDALRFLKHLRSSLQTGDWLLIGFDLKKDISTLIRAYSDSAGVTREFNFNLLRRLNRELGATFDLNTFQHYATYNPTLGAMESYLISTIAQTVWIEAAQQSIAFDAFEPIHTEYSFKYSERDIEYFATATGFARIENFYDRKRQFVDSLWRAV